jgi:hypothetical protein
MPDSPPMRRHWLLVALILWAALLLSHAPSLPAAWRGAVVYAHPFDLCDSHFALRAAPTPEAYNGAGSCDTIYSLRMGWDGWRRAADAWGGDGSILAFFAYNLWAVSVDARALNVLDLVLFVWPARLLFDPAAALVVLNLGLVALGALAGVLVARLMGQSALAGLAAGVVIGGSGVVSEHILRGQYPQAVLLGAVLFLVGLQRCYQDQRGGVWLAGGGAALAALLYWQNAVILGLGGIVLLVGLRADDRPAPGTVRRLVLGGLLSLLLAAPAAVPVLEAMAAGTEAKMELLPWGTAFPAWNEPDAVLLDLIDEVPWFELLSPRSGFLPALPLLPIAIYGLWRRRHAAWLGLVVLGLVLALGPFPPVPELFDGKTLLPWGDVPRREHPIYQWVYQWVPTASRQRHPMRWLGLSTIGFAVATAWGVDALRTRWPRLIPGVVVGALAWVALVGPWPLRQSPFPQDVVDAFAGCEAIVLDRVPIGEREVDDLQRLEGLLWLPRAPVQSQGTGGTGKPTEAFRTWARAHEGALQRLMVGGKVRREDLESLRGSCVVQEASWSPEGHDQRRQALDANLGPPSAVLPVRGLFAKESAPRTLRIYRLDAVLARLPPNAAGAR